MDNATRNQIGARCNQANMLAKASGFYFSEEVTVERWEENEERLYCIRSHAQPTFLHFVPGDLVRHETLSLVGRVYKVGFTDGVNKGQDDFRKSFRQLIGLDS